MRLFFLVQVSDHHSICSDDRCLVILLCPRRCVRMCYACFCVCKLLVCGDVEENHGPTVDEMFETIINGQKAIGSDIAEIKTHLDKRFGNKSFL